MYPMQSEYTLKMLNSLTASDDQTKLASPALACKSRPSEFLYSTVRKFASSWAIFPELKTYDNPLTPQQHKRDKYLHVLSELLSTEVLDTQAYGSVPHIINHRVSAGLENGSIVEQYDQWTAELPMVEPFYALKSNPDPVIAKLLAALGCGFDCATQGEIDMISNGLGEEFSMRARGLATDKIIYANPAKMQSHLEFAVANGIRMTVFDGEDELYKLAKVNNTLPEGDKLKLLLRITTDDASSVCRFSKKFGCPVDMATELLEVTKELDLHVAGVSFHVGSGCGDPGAYATAFSHAAHLFNAADKLGMPPMEMVDIGGGFPGDNVGTYRKDAPTFPMIAQTVRNAIEQFKTSINQERPRELRFIAEPGRYFVSRSTTIATQVYGRKGGLKSKQ
jgi:ornithine decarboxylase